MSEHSLVYIRSAKGNFVGCGVLVEGGYVATCRHVWRDAVRGQDAPLEERELRIEFPYAQKNGVAVQSLGRLTDACEEAAGSPPDLVLLEPETVPTKIMPLPLARQDRLETGEGIAFAGLLRDDGRTGTVLREVEIAGKLAGRLDGKGFRQFTGVGRDHWFDEGSSGSPVFLQNGMQLAGIVSASELGWNQAKSALKVAFLIPATTIRSYVLRLRAARVAEAEHLDLRTFQPILEVLGEQDLPIADIADRLLQFVQAAKEHAAEPVTPSNQGADIEAAIGASRERLRSLDTGGAREVLQAKIDEEEQARVLRLVPLLKERAVVERLAFDYAAARATLIQITHFSPDDPWIWIVLGDICRVTGDLAAAMEAYQSAETAARRGGDEHYLSISYERIGDVLVANGNREDALASYRMSLALAETLASRDPANTEWQRGLSVTQERIGDVMVAQGHSADALASYWASLAIRETLARGDQANAQLQRDLSVSHNKIGDVLIAQGDRDGALASYRASLAIRETLAHGDPADAGVQRDLSVSHERIGDVLVAEGDRERALTSYQASHTISETLARRDPANMERQRDLSVSYERIGDMLAALRGREDALASYRASLFIRETLARQDPANTQWKRDLIVSYVKLSETEPAEAEAFLLRAQDIARKLEAAGRLAPVDAWMIAELAGRIAALPKGPAQETN
jgi:predicted negative regulator of RcsB-dependent stress response